MSKFRLMPYIALLALCGCGGGDASQTEHKTKTTEAHKDKVDAFEDAMRAAEKNADAVASEQKKQLPSAK